MGRRSVDPTISLGEKLRDFSSGLSAEERDLFVGILEIAAAADGDVSGFEMRHGGPPRGTVGVSGGDEVTTIDVSSLVAQRQSAMSVTIRLLDLLGGGGEAVTRKFT